MTTVSRMPKTAQMSFLVKVLMFALISLLVILGIIANVAKSADYITSINTCRTSVILQDAGDIDIAGVEVFRPSPKICKTHDIKIPETKGIFIYDETRDGVMKNIADRMADCWYELGEGRVDDVFGSKKPWQRDKCFSCFTFTVDDISELKIQGITPNDLYKFMRDTPYKASAESKAYCTGEQDPKEDNCIKTTSPECERKGGRCIKEGAKTTESLYDNWSCDKGEKCYVEDTKMMTYLQYVYMSEGAGAVLFDPEMTAFEFDKEYAITYIADTSAKDLGLIAGAGMAVGASTALMAAAVLLAIPTGGLSVAVGAGIVTAAGVVAGTGAAVVTTAEMSLVDHFTNKDIDTILISDSVKTDNVCREERGITG
jgi:hypothetical protein